MTAGMIKLVSKGDESIELKKNKKSSLYYYKKNREHINKQRTKYGYFKYEDKIFAIPLRKISKKYKYELQKLDNIIFIENSDNQ